MSYEYIFYMWIANFCGAGLAVLIMGLIIHHQLTNWLNSFVENRIDHDDISIPISNVFPEKKKIIVKSDLSQWEQEQKKR